MFPCFDIPKVSVSIHAIHGECKEQAPVGHPQCRQQSVTCAGIIELVS